MIFRQASPGDLPYILGLEQKFREMRLLGGNDPATHQRQLSNPDCLYWIVENDARPAGFVILRDIHSKDRNVELLRIVVAEPGRGLGTEVLRAVMDKVFREFGAHRLWLDTYSDNSRAQHVYRSVGFSQEGVLRECKKWGDEYRSLVLMSILESEYRVRINRS
jgi:RimJ/RimL family protein N-acetyltransferase